MSRQQNTDSFFSGADKVGTFLFANLIWVALSLTLIGIPFATVGIFAMMNEWVQERQPEFFKIFWGAIREHWRKALVVGLLDLAIGGLIFINFSIFQLMEFNNVMAMLSRTMTVCVAGVLIAVNIYVWSCIPLLDLTIRNHLKLSLILVLTYPLSSLAVTIAVLLPIIVSFFLPIAFFLFVTISTTAYLSARGTWWMLNRHFSDEDLQQLIAHSSSS